MTCFPILTLSEVITSLCPGFVRRSVASSPGWSVCRNFLKVKVRYTCMLLSQHLCTFITIQILHPPPPHTVLRRKERIKPCSKQREKKKKLKFFFLRICKIDMFVLINLMILLYSGVVGDKFTPDTQNFAPLLSKQYTFLYVM